MKSGHYSLECDMTAYVWGHGGSVFTADGRCSLNDAKAIAGIDYMRELQTYMPNTVTTYDWDGRRGDPQGQGGQVLTWGENFPDWDDPTKSQVSGLMQPARRRPRRSYAHQIRPGSRRRRRLGTRAAAPTVCPVTRSRPTPPGSSSMGDQRRHPDPRLDPGRRGEPDAPLDLRRPAGGRDEAGRRRHHPPLRRDAANDRVPDGDRAPFAAVAGDRDRRDRRRARQAHHRRLRVDEGRRRRDRQKGQRSGQIASRYIAEVRAPHLGPGKTASPRHLPSLAPRLRPKGSIVVSRVMIPGEGHGYGPGNAARLCHRPSVFLTKLMSNSSAGFGALSAVMISATTCDCTKLWTPASFAMQSLVRAG